jgi:hypothetical protein
MSADSPYAQLAAKTAAAWAARISADHNQPVELQTVAAVVLDLQAQVQALSAQAADARRLARNLGSDMLYTLEDAYVPGENNSGDPAHALLYLARGWQREGERIYMADCTEGRQVTEQVAQLDLSPVL